MDNYILSLDFPDIKRFQRFRMGWDIVLILLAVIAGFSLATGEEAINVILEVLMSAGALPLVLALPLIMADWSVRAFGRNCCQPESCICFFFRDCSLLIAYITFLLLFLVGFIGLLMRDKSTLWGALAEVMMEVGIMYTVGTFLGIAPIDTNDLRALLTEKQMKQVQRSRTLHAPYANPVDYVLASAAEDDQEMQLVHSQMNYHFPYSVDADFESVEEEFEETRQEIEQEGGDAQALASRVLLDSAPGWDDPWYIAALGCCAVQHIRDLIPGLLSFVSGAAFPRDRYVVQAAVTSIGNLYFGSGSRKITSRLFWMWNNHEISDVRDHCVVALRAIGAGETVAFMNQLLEPKTLLSSTVAEQYFKVHDVSTDLLHTPKLGEIVNQLASIAAPSHEVSLMLMVQACVLAGGSNASGPELKGLIIAIGEKVLPNPLERHAVMTVGLEAMRRAVERCKALGAWDEATRASAHRSGNWACRTSVFKSVREGAQALLQEADYQYMTVYKLFGDASATDYYKDNSCDSDDIQELMTEHLGETLYYQLVGVLESMRNPIEEIGDMFEEFSSTKKRISSADTSNPTRDPALLLYAYMAQNDWPRVPNREIQKRLNSVDRLERYVGVLCIAHYGRNAAKIREKVLPRFAQCELISDVRKMAQFVLEIDHEDLFECKMPWQDGGDITKDQREELVKKELANLKEKVASKPGYSIERIEEYTLPLIATAYPLPQSVPESNAPAPAPAYSLPKSSMPVATAYPLPKASMPGYPMPTETLPASSMPKYSVPLRGDSLRLQPPPQPLISLQ